MLSKENEKDKNRIREITYFRRKQREETEILKGDGLRICTKCKL